MHIGQNVSRVLRTFPFMFFQGKILLHQKIDRLSEKDIEDITILMQGIDRKLLDVCIAETYDNIVYPDRKERYTKKPGTLQRTVWETGRCLCIGL